MTTQNPGLTQGAVLMVIAALAFIGYAVVFFIRNFTGTSFELGVETLNGVTRDQLNALNPAIVHYIGHLHCAKRPGDWVLRNPITGSAGCCALGASGAAKSSRVMAMKSRAMVGLIVIRPE